MKKLRHHVSIDYVIPVKCRVFTMFKAASWYSFVTNWETLL